jgi:hypothetical protein
MCNVSASEFAKKPMNSPKLISKSTADNPKNKNHNGSVNANSMIFNKQQFDKFDLIVSIQL